MNSQDILGEGGLIARRLANYEHRRQQLTMAGAVADAMANKNHLVVEAGTGVGKSFGYLVPAILSLQKNQEAELAPKRRIVISTHTIALQEQLIKKDIPFLNSIIPLEFSAVLAKGRNNYVSLRRVKVALQKQDSLFETREELRHLDKLRVWAAKTEDGSRADLRFGVPHQVWAEVQSEASNCLGRRCSTYQGCHYFKARTRMQNADLIIVNHALFFSDLSLRRMGINLLPDYQAVILDEAHTVLDVASDHLGLGVTLRQVEFALNKLYNSRNNKGLLVEHRRGDLQQEVVKCGNLCDEFFGDVQHWMTLHAGGNSRSSSVRVDKPGVVANGLSPSLVRLANQVRYLGETVNNLSEKQELVSAAERLEGLAGPIEAWRLHELEDSVYWIEASANRYGRENVKLCAAPIDIGPVLRKHLFDKVECCVLTSATLAVGRQSFDFFQKRVGLTQAKGVKLGSPFDYRRQAKLILVTNLAEPIGNQRETHERQAIEAIKKYVARTDGHAFVLFTSYQFLKRAERELSPWLTEQDYRLLVQSGGVDRTRLLEQFKATPRSVLFGTDSFWQGVDVPGKALQNVIITKLPFSVPDQPLLSARLDAIRKSGGNPFMEYSVPEAIIKFKQGVGRLIRSKTDSGIIVILDPRIKTKRYGQLFLDSLPDCQVVVEPLK